MAVHERYMFQAPWMAFWPGFALAIVLWSKHVWRCRERSTGPEIEGWRWTLWTENYKA